MFLLATMRAQLKVDDELPLKAEEPKTHNSWSSSGQKKDAWRGARTDFPMIR
jgi:hypothetical protein